MLIDSASEVMQSSEYVRLFVCLSGREQDYAQSFQAIFMKSCSTRDYAVTIYCTLIIFIDTRRWGYQIAYGPYTL